MSLTIGFGVNIDSSIFLNGHAITAYTVYKALSKKYTDASFVFINCLSNQKLEWYSDAKGCALPVTTMDAVTAAANIDIYIDFTDAVYPGRPGTAANILFVRKPALLHTSERCIYPALQTVYHPAGYSEVWTWDTVSQDDLFFLEQIYKAPVKTLPILWTPELAVTHFNEMCATIQGLPQDMTWYHTEGLVPADKGWTIRSCESNISQMNPYILPLFIARQLKASGKVPIDRFILHNSEHFSGNAFFKDNIHPYWTDVFDASSGSYEYGGRQRLVDWILAPRTAVVHYMRFRQWKPALFDCFWFGIPCIHNCRLLADIHPLFARYYYEGNSISGAITAFSNLHNDWVKKEGVFMTNMHLLIKNILLERFDCCRPAVLPDLPVCCPACPAACPVSPVVTVTAAKSIHITFLNMWPHFDPYNNIITDILQNESIAVTAIVHTESSISKEHHIKTNIIVAGPFGNIPANVLVSSNIPIIFYSGENTSPIIHPNIVLNLGHTPDDDSNTIRLPHWVSCINWFGTTTKRGNPIQLPLELLTSPQKNNERNKFAAFIVSNPCNPIRNESFHKLSTYKPVASAGRLYNNVGSDLFTNTAGGGGGEEKKVEWLRDYRFCITYENAQVPGYVTEKLMHAKMAGCIPIYWGDSKQAACDFVPGSYIDCSQAPDDIVTAVRGIEENEELYNKIRTTPLLDDERIQFWRNKFHRIAQVFLQYIQTGQQQETGQAVTGQQQQPDSIIYTTYLSNRFLPSFHIWIASVLLIAPHSKQYVYLYQDILQKEVESLKHLWPSVQFIQFPQNVPEGAFVDFWNPKWYSAKLWLLNDIIHRLPTNTQVLFMDVAISIIKSPIQLLESARKHSIAFYEDNTQTNEQWFSSTFCQDLSVTGEELNAFQIWSGALSFIIGPASSIIKEAYKQSKSERLIVGPKWDGLDSKGRPKGHRHDQSILGLLALRHNIPLIPLKPDYADQTSDVSTLANASYYVHRQLLPIQQLYHTLFKEAALPTYLVNLDRRQDRLVEFCKWEPNNYIKHIQRLSATDGKSIQLTKEIAQLFRNNTYKWKKSTMGCAHSHYKLWQHIVASGNPESIIIEDDVRIAPHFISWYTTASKNLPPDWDILYIGGVLPKNSQMLNQTLEPYNTFWAAIKSNTLYGQQQPTPYFHFCTYSYIISHRGALKLLAFCEKVGLILPADHMIVNNYELLKIFVATPLQAGCMQDGDPQYIEGQFADYSQKNTFDSDIWNSTDCFTEDEVATVLATTTS